MQTANDLSTILNRISGRGYKAYKDLKGAYYFEREDYTLFIDYVQGDPFAAASKFRVRVNQQKAGFPKDTYQNRPREIALRDFITRAFSYAIGQFAQGVRGSGISGEIGIDAPGQQILERTSVFVTSEYVEARFTIGLPAFGRKIAGREAQFILFEQLPNIIGQSMVFSQLQAKQVYRHLAINEDAEHLRQQLADRQLLAFVANGSVLPRKTGISDKPLEAAKAIPFEAPPELEERVHLPNAGLVKGMAIPEGVTLIVGGGFHGKSTLLRALERGVYNHVPGDGRELVITVPDAVKIRAEDGRRVEKVNISPFITNLPLGQDTAAFATENASGSTSQAANIIEACEVGAKVLLIDEDTSATNFMIRDERMQQLIAKEYEPITPFLDKVRQLYHDKNVSTLLVMGGTSDYFDKADTIIGMNNYRAYNYTPQVREILKMNGSARTAEGGPHFGNISARYPLSKSVDPSRGKKEKRIRVYNPDEIQFGQYSILLKAVEQLVDASQANAIGEAIVFLKPYMDGRHSVNDLLNLLEDTVKQYGLNHLGAPKAGNYAAFRRYELAAALNRLPSLLVATEKVENSITSNRPADAGKQQLPK